MKVVVKLTKGVKVYIHKYTFAYKETSEPTSQELYHSTAWDSKIGALDSAGTDFEAPYKIMKNNMYYVDRYAQTPKRTWPSDIFWNFSIHFDEAPIEIGVSRKFGHYIAGDFSTADYESDPIGYIDGYYYSS